MTGQPTHPDKVRLIIADDHFVVREGLRLILEATGRFEIVGEALNGKEAVMLTEQHRPDLILMDLRMPGMDGLEAIQLIKAQWHDIAIVILTTYNEDSLMVQGLQLGAQGYLLKDTGRETLLNTIDAALRGETLLSPETTKRLMDYMASSSKQAAPNHSEEETPFALTSREIEVLQQVAKGVSSKAIAFDLGISERTVKAHLENIFTKFGVNTRAAAVSIALQYNLLQDV
ncbi:MAG TPA: response regulator transcription factor [Aggregatilineales bacterium]|nr:response regulator transcription factor [Anaerolineales bacterium]HRE49685.1 response regulator transcription factor [Aggregatilineales bacterium]